MNITEEEIINIMLGCSEPILTVRGEYLIIKEPHFQLIAKSIIDKIRKNENIEKIKSVYEVNSPEGEFGMG